MKKKKATTYQLSHFIIMTIQQDNWSQRGVTFVGATINLLQDTKNTL